MKCSEEKQNIKQMVLKTINKSDIKGSRKVVYSCKRKNHMEGSKK